MAAPLIPQKPINKAVYDAIHMACMAHVELMPHTQAIIDEREELIKSIENKISRSAAGNLSDNSMALACQFGDEMFRLGIAIGRNPESIFDMPNTD